MSILGAIAGDIIGSRFEHSPIKTTDFELFAVGCRFTDDTVLTVAVADALLSGRNYSAVLEGYYYRYPQVPYGARFHDWARGREHLPYFSWGNGSAMRVSPVAYVSLDPDIVLAEAQRSAEVTHNHPEGIRGAQAVALGILLARTGVTKADISKQIEARFGYDLSKSVADIRPHYVCDLSCQHSVPEAFACFLDSKDFESAVRNAVSLGGDADTIACISGSLAAAFYGGVPAWLEQRVEHYLDGFLMAVARSFIGRFGNVEQVGRENAG